MKQFIANIIRCLQYFSWDITKSSCFFWIQARTLFFVISDTIISVKWNKDSVDTFFLIIFTFGWSLDFSRAKSTGSTKAVVFETKYSRVDLVKFIEDSLYFLLSVKYIIQYLNKTFSLLSYITYYKSFLFISYSIFICSVFQVLSFKFRPFHNGFSQSTVHIWCVTCPNNFCF